MNDKAINLPEPAYPPAARAVRAAGAVNVQITVDENGNVISASAVSGHPLLRAAAVAAARGAKFKPALANGKPTKVTGVLVFNLGRVSLNRCIAAVLDCPWLCSWLNSVANNWAKGFVKPASTAFTICWPL